MEPLDSRKYLNLATLVADSIWWRKTQTQRARHIHHQKSPSPAAAHGCRENASVSSLLSIQVRWLAEWQPAPKIAIKATSSEHYFCPFPLSYAACFWLKAPPRSHCLFRGWRSLVWLEVPAPLWLLLTWQPIPLVLMCSYRIARKAQVLAFPILSHWGWDIMNGPHS